MIQVFDICLQNVCGGVLSPELLQSVAVAVRGTEHLEHFQHSRAICMPFLGGILWWAPSITPREDSPAGAAWSLWHWQLTQWKTPLGLGREAHSNVGAFICSLFPFLLEFLLGLWVFLLEHIWVSFCPHLDVGSVVALSRFSWEQLKGETGPGKLLEVRTFTDLVGCVSRGGKKDSSHKNNSLPCLVETNLFSSRTKPLFFIQQIRLFCCFNGFTNCISY